MIRGWKSISFGVACAASVVHTNAVFAECPCKKANIYQISQASPPSGSPLTPIPMPGELNAPPAPQFQPGLPPAPPPGTSIGPAPGYVPAPRIPQPGPDQPGDIDGAPMPLGQPITPTPLAGHAPPPAQVGNMDRPGYNRFGMAPPPGTLGRTYQQRSRIFDDEKNPRMGAVDVFLPEDIDVSARGMKSVWTGKHWRLEAKDPLLPGVPHIYAIKAERKNKEGEVLSTDVRWIRLIPGRVVDLQF